MSAKPPTTLPQFDVFMDTIVAKLPQAQHIREEDAKVWYEATKQIEPERFLWHCERLKGIGGSDIGELVAAKEGEYNAFKTPYDIINEKLMIKTIDGGTKHTRFGTLMEPVSQALFHEKFNCTSNQQLINQVNAHASERHPWMRSNVDDIVSIGGQNTDPNVNGVIVVDYKNKAKIPGEPSTQEKSQVTQYNYALEESGFQGPVGRALAYTDFAAKDIEVRPVDLNPRLLKSLLNSGDEAWEHVLNNTKPGFSVAVKTDLVFSDESKEKIESLESRIVKAKVIAEAAKTQVGELEGELKKEIKSQTGEALVKGQTMPLKLLGTTIRQKLIVPELEQLIESQQLNGDDFKKTGKKIDEEKVASFITVAGGDPADYVEKVYDIKKNQRVL